MPADLGSSNQVESWWRPRRWRESGVGRRRVEFVEAITETQTRWGRGSQTDVPDATGLRLGFISPSERLTPDSVSGMPLRMRSELERRFGEVRTFGLGREAGGPPAMRGPVEQQIRAVGRPVARAVRTVLREVRIGRDRLMPGRIYGEVLARARAKSAGIQREIGSHPTDVLFGCCISAALAGLETGTPTVYFSDATARIINSTYPAAMRLGRGYHEACDELERVVMRKVSAAVFASEATLRSAIEDYGLDPSRGHLVEMGAHVTPGADERVCLPRVEGRRIRLCIVAVDAVRKRVDMAVGVTERLRARGWDAELTHIGRPTRRSGRSEAVRCAGRLRLSNESDRRTHAGILASSHLLLLPSLGEAYGIAPCEAAHFGRPSVVSAAGGLPTVVEHGKTGLVMPMTADEEAYATAIDGLLSDPDRYARMCAAALRRAREVLTWERWAERVTRIAELAVAGSGAGEIVVPARGR